MILSALQPVVPTRRASAVVPLPSVQDGWLAPGLDPLAVHGAGIKLAGGGTHQSKTMMLGDLATLMAAGGKGDLHRAVVEENVLGKPSRRAREAAAKRLAELYGVGGEAAVWHVLSALWRRDPEGRPVLALLCALARDPVLRATAAPVLDAALGEPVRAQHIAAAVEDLHPGRFGGKMLASLSRNAASTWMQAGFLSRSARKVRVRASATPAAAAYAALLAGLCGFGGQRLLGCRWLDVLDCPAEERTGLLRQAEGMGLVRVRSAGDVLEVEARRPMAGTLGIPSLVGG